MTTPHLSRCPNCQYSLSGLPRAHRCPECGLQYDERTRIWRARHPAWAYWTPLGIVLTVVLSGIDKIAVGDWSRVLRWLILFSPILGFWLWRIWSVNRQGRYIAITPEGLRMRTLIAGSPVETNIAWTEFSWAQQLAWNKVEITCHDGRRILVEGIFGTGDVGDFCQEAWTAKRRHDPAVTDYDREKWKRLANDGDDSDHESGGEQ